ncbi:MAG: hypothetical protein ABR507_09255 [Actinomycetota bacterium]|nr:hypothetical protein [Actinomycetota bacterium]
MEGTLALQQRIRALPGVLDFRVKRDVRGAVMQVDALVSDDASAIVVSRELVALVGARFVAERASIRVAHSDAEQEAAQTNGSSTGHEPSKLSNIPIETRRIRIVQVSSTLQREQTSVEVVLALDGETAKSTRTGPSIPGASLRLAAVSAVEGVNKIWGPIEALIEDVATLALGGESVVVVALAVNLPEGWQRLHGASGTSDGAPEAAAVRAVLAALNRPVAN